MDAELQLPAEPCTAPYVTLRRPRIRQASAQADCSKRQCQRPYSPTGTVGAGIEPVAASAQRHGTPLAGTPFPRRADEPPAFSRASALTPVLEPLCPVPPLPEAGRPSRLAAKRRRPPRARASGSPLERESGRVLSVTLENCLPGTDQGTAFETPMRIASNGVSRRIPRPSPESSLPNQRLNVWKSLPEPGATARLRGPEDEEESEPSPLRECPDRSPPGPAAAWPTPPGGRDPPQAGPLSAPAASSPPHWAPPPFLYSRWKLSPFIRNVKSKLESFAGIFLSPVRSHLAWPSPEPPAGAPADPPSPAGHPSGREGEPPAAPASRPSEGPTSPAPSGVNIRVQIAISGSEASHPRPPGGHPRPWQQPQPPAPGHQPRLSRSRSCPDLPAHPCRLPPAPRTRPPPRRHRRHTLGGAEPSRELAGRPPPPALLCLRKEVFPACGGSLAASKRESRCCCCCCAPPSSVLQPVPGCRESAVRGRQGASPTRQDSPLGDGVETPSPQPVPENGFPGSLTAERNEPRVADGNTPKKRKLQPLIHDCQEVTTPVTGVKATQPPGGKDLGKVSRFRIRKTPAKPQTNLTPMGLPKPARLNKKEFSLEEIYTNKNYKAPTEKRSFETIFEEPVRRNGLLVLTSQRRLKRAVEFQDSSLPRKRRLRQRLRQAQRGPGWSRGLRSAMKEPELELLLRQRLEELDALSAAEDNSDE